MEKNGKMHITCQKYDCSGVVPLPINRWCGNKQILLFSFRKWAEAVGKIRVFGVRCHWGVPPTLAPGEHHEHEWSFLCIPKTFHVILPPDQQSANVLYSLQPAPFSSKHLQARMRTPPHRGLMLLGLPAQPSGPESS